MAINPTSNQLQSNSIKQNSSRQKVDGDRKEAESKEEPREAPKNTDSLEVNLGALERSEQRGEQEPITDDRQAAEIISFTSQQLTLDADKAEKAQANLSPDKVLELIA